MNRLDFFGSMSIDKIWRRTKYSYEAHPVELRKAKGNKQSMAQTDRKIGIKLIAFTTFFLSFFYLEIY